MPKIIRMTDEEKRRAKMARMIIKECAANDDIKNLAGLARKMDIDYNVLWQRVHRRNMPALFVNEILHALNASPETVARFYKI